jgi:hypothetical protein
MSRPPGHEREAKNGSDAYGQRCVAAAHRPGERAAGEEHERAVDGGRDRDLGRQRGADGDRQRRVVDAELQRDITAIVAGSTTEISNSSSTPATQ